MGGEVGFLAQILKFASVSVWGYFRWERRREGSQPEQYIPGYHRSVLAEHSE